MPVLGLGLGCAVTVQTQPEPAEPSKVAAIEAEPAPAQPAEPEPAEPVEQTEPAESTEPTANASAAGHVIQPQDPVATPGTVPVLTPTEPVVGALDKDVIRRVVRAHINEIRDCYNLGLATDPALAGRIAIEFVIGPSGAVEQATATDTTGFADPAVPNCIADAILTWTFPEPRGGARVTVSYPFNLVPG